MLGGDGENAVLQVQVDVALIKAGQISLQQVVVALVLDVGAEGGQLALAGGGHGTLKFIKQVVEAVAHTSKGNHAIHNQNSFRPNGEWFVFAPGPF